MTCKNQIEHIRRTIERELWVRIDYDYHVHHLAIVSTQRCSSSRSIYSELLLKDTQYDTGSDTFISVAILPKRSIKLGVPTDYSKLDTMSYAGGKSVPYRWCADLCSEVSEDAMA